MRACELVYGPAADVADWLMQADARDVEVSDLVGALANAMRCIDTLERRLATVEQVIKQD